MARMADSGSRWVGKTSEPKRVPADVVPSYCPESRIENQTAVELVPTTINESQNNM